MEVMFSWAGGGTPWLNRDQPGGVGDYETISDHLKIQCRFKATGNAITDGAPVGYHCNIKEGGWCKNNDPAGLRCQDMEVMFSCVGCAATPQETFGELFNEAGARARPLGPNPVIGQPETGARARPLDRNPVEPNPVVGQLPRCGRGISKGDSCCATGNGQCQVARGDGSYYRVMEGGPFDHGQCDCSTR